MSKNILKQLQLQLKSHNNKLITSLKSDISKTYTTKQKELDSAYAYKEQKIKKAYEKFIKKVVSWQDTQNKEIDVIKTQLDKISKMINNVDAKNVKFNKRIDNIKNELKSELKKEISESTAMKKRCESDIAEMKRNVERKS